MMHAHLMDNGYRQVGNGVYMHESVVGSAKLVPGPHPLHPVHCVLFPDDQAEAAPVAAFDHPDRLAVHLNQPGRPVRVKGA